MRKSVLILGHNAATQFIDIYNQYTRLFDPAEYEVTVAYLCGAPDAAVKARTLAEQVLFLNVPKKNIRYLKIGAIAQLLRLCKQKQFSMVICHRYKPIYLMLWVAQCYKITQLVFVMHELRTLKARGRQLLIAALGRKNMLFAGVSNAVRDDMRQSLWCIPKERVVTLYNMIDIDLTEPQFFSREKARAQLHLPADAFIFGNLARLVPNKDQSSLIRAFALIKPHCPNSKLVIMGHGDLETSLKQEVEHYGLNDDIIFMGFVEAGFRYMKAFDCFVLSSTQEAFGRVLLEAMLAKLPIIATRVHGIPEVMGDQGLLLPAKEPAVFAQAMRDVYAWAADERAQMGERAYVHITTQFSIPAFKQQFWQLLTSANVTC